MDALSLAVCFFVIYLVAGTMYRSAKAGWRPAYRPNELTDMLL